MNINYESALNVPIGDNDSGKQDVRGYLSELLKTLWAEEEGFSGKRPFGNSGWKHEIIGPLVKAGFIPGHTDGDGYYYANNRDEANAYVMELIVYMCSP